MGALQGVCVCVCVCDIDLMGALQGGRVGH